MDHPGRYPGRARVRPSVAVLRPFFRGVRRLLYGVRKLLAPFVQEVGAWNLCAACCDVCTTATPTFRGERYTLLPAFGGYPGLYSVFHCAWCAPSSTVRGSARLGVVRVIKVGAGVWRRRCSRGSIADECRAQPASSGWRASLTAVCTAPSALQGGAPGPTSGTNLTHSMGQRSAYSANCAARRRCCCRCRR